MYCLQQRYGLADEALEDDLYDSQALRDFVCIDVSRESMPDATTLLKFRRLLCKTTISRSRCSGKSMCASPQPSIPACQKAKAKHQGLCRNALGPFRGCLALSRRASGIKG